MNEITKILFSRKAEYTQYCKTPIFKQLKEARHKLDNYECVLCGQKAQTIHHRRYPEIFGTESINDVVSICFKCHKNFHIPPSIDELKKAGVEGRCQLCDRIITKLNPHILCAGKIAVLKHFAHLKNEGYDWIKTVNGSKDFYTHDGKTHQSIKESRVHAQRLAWFGLLDHKCGRKEGGYKINQFGINFLENKLKMPYKIWTRDGEVVKVEKKQVSINEVKHVVLGMSYYDMYASLQRHRHEFERKEL